MACDVENPLCGENGSSHVFAYQKGGIDETIAMMDKWLDNFAELTKTVNPYSNKNTPGVV